MNPLLLFGIAIWLYLLSVLKRAHLSAFYFIVGSVGLFFILIALSNPYWVWFFTHAVVTAIQGLGALTGMCVVMAKYGIVHILSAHATVTMTIDYECSGIIETMAFLGLVIFFPTYTRRERIFYAVLGILWIYLDNVLRLAIVVTIVHFAGPSSFFLAHTIIGRLVFYVLVIMLYYNVFTYSQLARGLYARFSWHRGGETE